MMEIEVDNDTVHEEAPAEASDQLTMLMHEGVSLERIKASNCDTEEKSKIAASNILTIIKKHKDSR